MMSRVNDPDPQPEPQTRYTVMIPRSLRRRLKIREIDSGMGTSQLAVTLLMRGLEIEEELGEILKAGIEVVNARKGAQHDERDTSEQPSGRSSE